MPTKIKQLTALNELIYIYTHIYAVKCSNCISPSYCTLHGMLNILLPIFLNFKFLDTVYCT